LSILVKNGRYNFLWFITKMWLTFLIVIVVDWSGASVTPRGLSDQDVTLERATRVKRLIGRPLESTLAERKSTTSYGEEPFLFLFKEYQ